MSTKRTKGTKGARRSGERIARGPEAGRPDGSHQVVIVAGNDPVLHLLPEPDPGRVPALIFVAARRVGPRVEAQLVGPTHEPQPLAFSGFDLPHDSTSFAAHDSSVAIVRSDAPGPPRRSVCMSRPSAAWV